MRMEDFSKTFPARVDMALYLPIIEAAQKAVKGVDGKPRVVIEDYPDYKQATKAANAIRNYARAQKLDLRVSCPENKSCDYVFKSTLPPRTRKKKSESSALPPAVSDDAAPPVQS